MYDNVQAPMLKAAAGGDDPPAQSLAVIPFKTMLQGGSASGLLPSLRILGALSLLPSFMVPHLLPFITVLQCVILSVA